MTSIKFSTLFIPDINIFVWQIQVVMLSSLCVVFCVKPRIFAMNEYHLTELSKQTCCKVYLFII